MLDDNGLYVTVHEEKVSVLMCLTDFEDCFKRLGYETQIDGVLNSISLRSSDYGRFRVILTVIFSFSRIQFGKKREYTVL